MKRLGRDGLYCPTREGRRASQLVEPRTPCILCRGVSVCQLTLDRDQCQVSAIFRQGPPFVFSRLQPVWLRPVWPELQYRLVFSQLQPVWLQYRLVFSRPRRAEPQPGLASDGGDPDDQKGRDIGHQELRGCLAAYSRDCHQDVRASPAYAAV